MPDLDFTGVDPADYIDATWDDQNGKPWRAHPNGMWYEYAEPVTGGTTTFAELTDAATADLPALNTPLAAALAGKQATLTLKTINSNSLLGAGNLTISSNLTSGPVTSSGGVSAIADGVLSIAKTSGLQTALDTKLASATAATSYAPIRRLLSATAPNAVFTAAVGDRITLDNTSTVARINDPTTTPTGGALTDGMMYTVIIQRGTMWFGGVVPVFAASRLELVRAYNGSAWSTLGSVVSDTLTVGALTSNGAISGTTGTFSGAVSVIAGTAAATSIRHPSAAGIGLYFPSTTQTAFATGGFQTLLHGVGYVQIPSNSSATTFLLGASGDVAFSRISPGIAGIATSFAGGSGGSLNLTNLTASGTVTAARYIEGVTALGTVVSAATITITGGSSVTAQLTASTACTFTLPTAAAGLSFVLHLKQAAATGNGTATFTGVIWSGGTAPTITPTAGRMDILSFITGPNAAGNGWQWFGSVIPNVLPS